MREGRVWQWICDHRIYSSLTATGIATLTNNVMMQNGQFPEKSLLTYLYEVSPIAENIFVAAHAYAFFSAIFYLGRTFKSARSMIAGLRHSVAYNAKRGKDIDEFDYILKVKPYYRESGPLDLGLAALSFHNNNEQRGFSCLRDYLRAKKKSEWMMRLESANLWGKLANHVAVPIEKKLYLNQEKYQTGFAQEMILVIKAMQNEQWTSARKQIKQLYREDIRPLSKRAFMAELFCYLHPESTEDIWTAFIRDAHKEGGFSRIGMSTTYVLKSCPDEVVKIKEGDRRSLEDIVSLNSAADRIIDHANENVPVTLGLLDEENASLLIYRHIDGMPLTHINPDESAITRESYLRSATSLVHLLARLDHPCLHRRDAERQSFIDRYAHVAHHARTAHERDVLHAAQELLHHHATQGMPLVMDKDARRSNILVDYGMDNNAIRIAHIDFENKGHTPLSTEIAKFIYLGDRIPYEQDIYAAATTAYNRSVGKKQTKIDQEHLRFAAMNAAAIKAVTYAAWADDRPHEHVLAQTFSRNASTCLRTLLDEYPAEYTNERDIMHEMSSVLEQHARGERMTQLPEVQRADALSL